MKKVLSNFSECVGSTLCNDHAVSAACLPDQVMFGADKPVVYALGKLVFVES